MKGITKITLTDSLSGQCQGEYINENMITDGVFNVLNPKMQWCLSGDNFASMLIQATPLWRRLYGGIILWDSLVPEGTTNILPKAGINAIGYAGTEYSGANPFRGTFNQTESGLIDGGCRLVWDFSTDKANGTIKCLSLTSSRGGNSCMRNTVDSDVGAIMTPFNMGDSQNISNGFKESGFSQSSTYLKGMFRKNTYTYAKVVSGKLYLYDVTVADTDNLPVGVNLSTGDGQVVSVVENIIESSYVFGDAPSIFTDENGKLHSLKLSQGTTYQYIKVDPITRTVEEERLISFPSNGKYNVTSYAVFKGIFYVFNTILGVVERFSSQGELLDGFIPLSTSPVGMSIIGDYLVMIAGGKITFWDGNNYCSNGITYSSIPQFVYQFAPQYPYLLTNYGYLIFAPYMASINNLSEAITKTDTQTMKITYELLSE